MPGFEHESEKLERAAIRRRRDEEINWTPSRTADREWDEVEAQDLAEAAEQQVLRMKWIDLPDTETKGALQL